MCIFITVRLPEAQVVVDTQKDIFLSIHKSTIRRHTQNTNMYTYNTHIHTPFEKPTRRQHASIGLQETQTFPSIAQLFLFSHGSILHLMMILRSQQEGQDDVPYKREGGGRYQAKMYGYKYHRGCPCWDPKCPRGQDRFWYCLDQQSWQLREWYFS